MNALWGGLAHSLYNFFNNILTFLVHPMSMGAMEDIAQVGAEFVKTSLLSVRY